MMNSFFALVILFCKDLIRRRSLWIIFFLFCGILLVNYSIQKQLSEAIGQGVSYDIATKQAASQLQEIAKSFRYYAFFMVLFLSALVAPESRKNGTTQFALNLSVSRFKLALSQFTALSIFIFTAIIILHVGYFLIARNLGIMSTFEFLVSWIFLFLPILLCSAVVFSLSLSFSVITTYLIFLAFPLITSGLGKYLVMETSEFVPMFIVRFFNNLEFLIIYPEEVILWPSLSVIIPSKQPPFPDYTWNIIHLIFWAAFLLLLGLWLYKNYDFGSKAATK